MLKLCHLPAAGKREALARRFVPRRHFSRSQSVGATINVHTSAHSAAESTVNYLDVVLPSSKWKDVLRTDDLKCLRNKELELQEQFPDWPSEREKRMKLAIAHRGRRAQQGRAAQSRKKRILAETQELLKRIQDGSTIVDCLLQLRGDAVQLSSERIDKLRRKEEQLNKTHPEVLERIRRLRIGLGNAGSPPWNLGRKHSEGET